LVYPPANTEISPRSLRDALPISRAYPALAPRLTGPSPDPDVERVLEGVAFLTGRIRQKIDDDFPEFIQGLTQLIFPHYLRPLPRAEEHTSELQSRENLVCRLLLE